jgi:hypothetical protein
MILGHSRLAIASEAKQSSGLAQKLDCFVAIAPRNDEVTKFSRIMLFGGA